jgi:hypothetical protein
MELRTNGGFEPVKIYQVKKGVTSSKVPSPSKRASSSGIDGFVGLVVVQ